MIFKNRFNYISIFTKLSFWRQSTFLIFISLFLFFNLKGLSQESIQKEDGLKIFNKDPKYNPIFRGKQHLIEIGYASSWELNRPDNLTGANVHFSSLNNLYVRYAIPTHLFFHGRTALEFGSILGEIRGGYGNVNQVYASFTHELVFDLKYFYTTIGGGFAYRNIYGGVNSDQNRYDTIGSRLVFQVRIGIGINIKESINLELFFKHFSNGHLQLPNMGYNFIGLSLGFLI